MSKPYLQNEYLSCGPIYVKLAVGRIVRIDTLSSQKIDDVLRPVFIAISCCNLKSKGKLSVSLIMPLCWKTFHTFIGFMQKYFNSKKHNIKRVSPCITTTERAILFKKCNKRHASKNSV